MLIRRHSRKQAHPGGPQLPLSMHSRCNRHHRYQHHQSPGTQCHAGGSQQGPRRQRQGQQHHVLVVPLLAHHAHRAVYGTVNAAGKCRLLVPVRCVCVGLPWVLIEESRQLRLVLLPHHSCDGSDVTLSVCPLSPQQWHAACLQQACFKNTFISRQCQAQRATPQQAGTAKPHLALCQHAATIHSFTCCST